MMARPTLAEKIGSAIYVLSMLPDLPGVRTVHQLMWPHTTGYTTEDVRRQAVKVLASACTVLLEGVPLQQIERIWTVQDEYLSFALDTLPPGERSQSLATGSPPQVGAGGDSRSTEGPCHHDQLGSTGDSDACVAPAGKTVILSAPAGWGKSRQAEQLRAEFGCSHVVDPWELGTVERGALHLTHADPAHPRLQALAATAGAHVVARGWAAEGPAQ